MLELNWLSVTLSMDGSGIPVSSIGYKDSSDRKEFLNSEESQVFVCEVMGSVKKSSSLLSLSNTDEQQY